VRPQALCAGASAALGRRAHGERPIDVGVLVGSGG
jgi:hypothetical protein